MIDFHCLTETFISTWRKFECRQYNVILKMWNTCTSFYKTWNKFKKISISSLVYDRSFTVHIKLLNCALVCIYYVTVSHERLVAVKHRWNLFFVYSKYGIKLQISEWILYTVRMIYIFSQFTYIIIILSFKLNHLN